MAQEGEEAIRRQKDRFALARELKVKIEPTAAGKRVGTRGHLAPSWPSSGEGDTRIFGFIQKHGVSILRQYELNLREGNDSFPHFFLRLDYHMLMNDDPDLTHSLLLCSSEVGWSNADAWAKKMEVRQLLESALYQLLQVGRDDLSLQPGHFRLVLDWGHVPFTGFKSGSGLGCLTPRTIVGIAVSICRPIRVVCSRSLRCSNFGGEESAACLLAQSQHIVQIREGDPLFESSIERLACSECGAGLVEDQALRGECFQQRVSLLVCSPLHSEGALMQVRQVQLCTSEDRFLSPSNHLGVRVAALGRMTAVDVQSSSMIGFGEADRRRRHALVLMADSLRLLPRQSPPGVQHAFGFRIRSDLDDLDKVLGTADEPLYFYEKLLIHLTCLSSLLGPGSTSTTISSSSASTSSSSSASSYAAGEFGALSEKLSVLLFGPVFESLLRTFPQLGRLLGAGPTAVWSSSTSTPIAPQITCDYDGTASWSCFAAGIAHHARDELLVVPNLASLTKSDQHQLASIIERGAVTTKVLEVPSSECQLSVLGWCTVAENETLRRYLNKQVPLAKLLGGRVEPTLLQSFDLLCFVNDSRPVESVLDRSVPVLMTDDTAMWVRSAATLPGARMGAEAKALLQRYFECHRVARSLFTRREMYRVAVVAALCARLLHASVVGECHALLAMLLFETSLMWKGAEPLVTAGVPARSRADLDEFRLALFARLSW